MVADPDPAVIELVRHGWDAASRIYRPDASLEDLRAPGFAAYRDWLAPVFGAVPAGARVLDLGCGCGVPAAALLAERYAVTGVDLSETQVERARRRVPGATFQRADMRSVEFPPESFRAVVCLYALIHLPRASHRPLLARIRSWLPRGGPFVVITGHTELEGVEPDWLGSGAPMFWSHADAATYRRWLQAAGFEVRSQRFVPEGSGGHELFHALAV